MAVPVVSARYAASVFVLIVSIILVVLMSGAAGSSVEMSEMSCVSCPDGLFLNQTSLACAACPADSRVPDPANASSVLACACEAGFANTSAACAPCRLASYKPALGNATCTACPANTNTTAAARVGLAECLCAPGFFHEKVQLSAKTIVNVARACGASQNAACPTVWPLLGTGANFGFGSSLGNDNNLVAWTFSEGIPSINNPLRFRIDFQTPRQLSHITFHNRQDCCGERSLGGQIQVGDSHLFNVNPVCATLTSAKIQTHNCTLRGQYIFIVLPVTSITHLNFNELQAFVTTEATFADTCVPCAAGSFKGHISNGACAPCPVDTFCPPQSVAPVPCVGNSSRLEVGGQSLQDCLCRPGFLTNNSVSRTCRACPVGTFNAAFNQTACTACPAGTVNTQQAAADAAACIACGANAAAPAGSSDAAACKCNVGFAGEPGGVCVACAAGKFRSNLSEYICRECPPDTYNAELHVVSIESCLACPANTSTTNRTGSGSQLDCVCRPGFRTDTDDASKRQCAECGPGRFQPAHNASACDGCAAGTYSAARTAASAATCVGCAPGSFSTAVASSHCELCAADTWQDLRRVDAAREPCARCPRNASSVVTGAFNVSSCVCERGFRLADGSFVGGREDADAYGCVQCHAGNFCPGNGTSLTCPLNMWSAVRVNAGPCDACAVRSFALANAGMRSPDMCQCVAGAEGTADNNCSLCAAGSFQPCDFSVQREHAAEHSEACEELMLGLSNRSAATTMRCEPCPPNFYSDASGADSCSACPANASSPAGSEARSRCRCNAAFTGEDGGECATCPADSFCNGGLTHPCRLYSNSPADSDSADDCVCRAGFFSHNATSPCLKCPEDTYCPGGQTVNQCAFNSTSMMGSAVIEQCLCGPGTWRGCVDGRNADGDCTVDWSVGCFHCDAGDICVNSTLLQCPEHSTSLAGSDEGGDCKCNGGYFNVVSHEHAGNESNYAGHTHR